jgi:hypothetical protein
MFRKWRVAERQQQDATLKLVSGNPNSTHETLYIGLQENVIILEMFYIVLRSRHVNNVDQKELAFSA